jgi:ribosome recycling factor
LVEGIHAFHLARAARSRRARRRNAAKSRGIRTEFRARRRAARLCYTRRPMDLDTILLETEERMQRSTDYLGRELRGIRTGRANTALLEYIKVDYYGSHTDLRELAAISVAEATQLVVKPFDPSSKGDIVRAIETSGLGLNPMSEGNQIRINIPAPSSDRRKQLMSQVKKLAEDSKVAVRNERRDGNKAIDALVADKKNPVPEDSAKSAKEEIDTLTKKYCDQLDALAAKKCAEIEEV